MPSSCAPSTRSRRTLAPVAISATPYSTTSFVESVASRAAVSSRITLVLVASSIERFAYQPASWIRQASRSCAPARYPLDAGGRSYGGSGSRPTSRTEPPKPPSCSASAHAAPAAPPPTISAPTSRSATGAVRDEEAGDVLLEARVEHDQHLVAGLDHAVGLRHEAGAVAQHRDHERAVRQAQVCDALVGRAAALADDKLDDLEPLLGQVEEVDEPVARHLVLDQAQDQVGRGDGRLDPEQLEVRQVARVVAAGDDPLAQVLLLRDLADQQVVLVVARHRHDEVGALDPGALEHPQLGRVAVLDGVLELLLDGQVAAPVLLDHGDLVAALEQLAREVPADLARAGDDHVQAGHQAGSSAAFSSCSIAIWVGQIVCSPCSAYHAARRGSRMRAMTRGTSKRRCASCATTRFVLSPLVEAMKTSASSIPDSVSASSSSAVPIVKRPPASSHDWPSSTSSRSCESGSSSRTETVCPARRADVATEEPTRPAPTTRTNMRRGL